MVRVNVNVKARLGFRVGVSDQIEELYSRPILSRQFYNPSVCEFP